LLEKFIGKTNQYAVSLLGKKRFTAFSKEINSGVRDLLKNYKEKTKDDDDALPIKLKN
jgi:hypothetical protein